MKVEKRRVTSTVLEIIHEIYLTGKNLESSDRRTCFLAVFDFAVKVRPFGGLFGLDNSSLEKCSVVSKKFYDFLQFFMTSRDLFTKFVTSAFYCYLLPWSYNNSVIGIIFCLFLSN